MDDPSSCDGDNEDEFSFRAFRYSGQTESQKVVFTATTKVCYNGSAGCKCTNLSRGERAFEKLQRKAAIIIKSCLQAILN